jgi:twitching motility protein PilT
MSDLIKNLFHQAIKLKASDIHIHSDQPPAIRVDGRLFIMQDEPVVEHGQLEKIIDGVLRDDLRMLFRTAHQVDTAIEFPGVGTLRVHIYRQRGKLAMANRIIGSEIPNVEKLGLPPLVQQLVHQQRGLILVSGATSNGKSTTLASLIEEINKTYPRHILTIEDPIEFVFENKKSVFSQRDIGIDATSFSASIVAAMREDPDVILISDLRDNETIENALTAAETGHLVFATTHAPTAPDTITRLLSTFPAEKQDPIRVKLAQNLRAVVAQRLVPKKGGSGRILACEYMMMSARIKELMLDPLKVGDISTLLSGDNITKGVLSFDSHLAHLVSHNLIEHETALEFSTSTTDMKLRLSGLLN